LSRQSRKIPDIPITGLIFFSGKKRASILPAFGENRGDDQKTWRFHPTGETPRGVFMIRQNIQNFKLGTLRRTKVTASCGLALLMSFAKDIGLGKQLEFCFSHLKQRNRGYSVSAKILSFLLMIIKGGDRMSDIDLLRADPGLLALLRMEGVPRPNTLAELSRKFRQRDIHRLAECGMRLVVRALRLRKLRRVVLDIDSTLVESGVRIAERTYEGFWGFNPLLGKAAGWEARGGSGGGDSFCWSGKRGRSLPADRSAQTERPKSSLP
jgi:hypothetical protein